MVSITQVLFFAAVGIFGLTIVFKNASALWIAVALVAIACLIPTARFIFRR